MEDSYCPICQACGEEGCCSPLMCHQDKDGRFCSSYLRDLQFSYKMVQIFENEIYHHLSPELQELYTTSWHNIHDKIYTSNHA
jgi:hypothetical protein